MAGGGGGKNGVSLYAVLGVASDCSDAELRSAYRKLAMVRSLFWLLCFSPCSVSWDPRSAPLLTLRRGSWSEMAPRQVRLRGELRRRRGRGQVLSDPNKRILYDVGAYDSDGDDDGAGEILGDILDAMSQNGAENGKGESLEDMQRQFEELFLRPSPSSSFPPDDAGKSASKRRAARK
ncbi:uncharacterized protein [Setaria viridis]|uniref:uncharacterized protein isoform X1 n=1 Tax=Setaria viridis TaxID=4556 RepID=UPI003B3BE887